MEAIKTVTSKGRTLKIFYDEGAESPRNWDNLTKMIFVGKHNHLGDKHQHLQEGSYSNREDFIKRGAEQLVKEIKDIAIIKAIHLYDHSGVAISTSLGGVFSDRWDSGTIGFAVVTKADIRKNFMIKRITQKHLDQADKILEGEVETLNQYISGEVYGFKVLDKKGNETDSCWGFFGNDFKTNGILEHVENGNEFVELV